MTTPHKSFPFEFKADGESGTFEALVAVFNNVDGVGDRILPGAFTKTLNEWRQSGDPIPVIFNHDWASPDAHIGVAYPRDVKQTSKGLLVKGHLDITDNPVARQVYKLMARRSLKEFSFGYRVPAGGEQQAKDGANDISEIMLVEVGPTLKGCNPATELHAVKSALGVDAPSEQELRRRSDLAERDLQAPALSVSDASPDKALTERLEGEIETVKGQLRALQATFEQAAPPPAAESELRRASDRAERDLQADGLPAPADEPTPTRAELEAQIHTLSGVAKDLEEQLETAKSLPAVSITETDLRRRSAEIDRALKADGLPAATPEAPRPENPEMAELKAQLAAVQEQLGEALKPASSEADLRRSSERVDRSLKADGLPSRVDHQHEDAEKGLAEQVETLTADLAELKSMLADALKPPPASEAELRLATERLGRSDTKAQLPPTRPLSDLVEESQELAQLAQAQLDVLKASVDIGKRGKRLASDLRERLDAAGVERFGGRDIYVYVDDFDLDEGWVVYYVAGEATARRFVQVDYTADAAGAVTLATDEVEVVRTTTYRPKNGPKADKPGEATRPRPSDPLRKRSDQAVLEIQSDGASSRKPPPQVTQELVDEPPDTADLKRRSREVMLAQLTGDTA